jgi:hypothetical protein
MSDRPNRTRIFPPGVPFIVYGTGHRRSDANQSECVECRADFKSLNPAWLWKVEKNKDSVYFGKRGAGGWKPEGLLWTYTVDKNLPYKPDIDKIVAMN